MKSILSCLLLGTVLLSNGLDAANVTNACDNAIEFTAEAKVQHQHIPLSPTVSMDLTQQVAQQRFNKVVVVASNMVCQKLTGAAYTGSAQEWKKFIDSAINGLLKAGFKDLSFTAVGSDDKVYQGKLDHQEYILIGNTGGNIQHIHNLAVLDKSKNTVYTLSVSGNEKAQDAVKTEFKRLVGSFKPSKD